MKRKIVAFGMALLVFAGSSITALAGDCPHPNAQDGKHIFNYGQHEGCISQGWGEVKDLGCHSYLWGYDAKGNPIYIDCRMTQKVEYYRYACYLCGAQDLNGGHAHTNPIQHSISHS